MTTQTDESSSGENTTVNTTESCMPILICQALSAVKKDPVKLFINDRHQSQFTVLGLILESSEDDLNIIYKITDGTGVMTLKYLTTDATESIYIKDTYICASGRITSSDPSVLTVHNVFEVKDHNMIMYHNLNALYAHLRLTLGPLPDSAFNPNAEVKETVKVNTENVSEAILEFLRTQDQINGCATQTIVSTLTKEGFRDDDIRKALDTLEENAQIVTPKSGFYSIYE